MQVREFIPITEGPAKVAIFLSGSGTNAEKILERWKTLGDKCPFEPACLISDRPQSRARELSRQFSVPLVEHDIKEFYLERGLKTTSLMSEKGREVRQLWTEALIEKVKSYEIVFGIFAGFIPLCNITSEFPCLNVHPGDLTVLDEQGNRVLVGLHTRPLLEAVKLELDSLRSSVIIADAFADNGAGMDEGLILGLSPEVTIDWQGHDPEFYLNILNSRPAKKPAGGWGDALENLLDTALEKLKVNGDWKVFPSTVEDFAAGRFAVAEGNQLCYKINGRFMKCAAVSYNDTNREIIFE